MRLPFRQGIVRYQTDNNFPTPSPTFLQPSNGGESIDLVVAPDPTIITFAHGPDHDYLFEEKLSVSQAWSGFTSGTTDYWIYWDIDVNTAQRTFGWTTLQPIVSATMPTAVDDQHWFDSTNKVMKVASNGFFVEKLRVFAAVYVDGAIIQPYALGSQASLFVQSNPGTILFDENGDAIKQGKNRRVGRFVHTETNFSTQASSGSVIKIEAEVQIAQAVSNIAAYQLVSLINFNQITFASSNDLQNSIIGMVREALMTGDVGGYVTKGMVTNPFWDWTVAAGTSLFCDSTGQIVTDVPQSGSVQRVGHVVSPTSILLDIGEKYIIE